MTMPPITLILAGNHMMAHDVANLLGLRPDRWRYVHGVEGVRSAWPGDVFVFGDRWHENREWQDIKAEVVRRGMQMVQINTRLCKPRV